MMQSQIEAAKTYEALFVPALVGQFAPKVADAARAVKGERVLDVACGTGVPARETLTGVGPKRSVSGVASVPGMFSGAHQTRPACECAQGKADTLTSSAST